MKKGERETDRLDNANSQLGVELWRVKSGLDIYRVIALNKTSIKSGKAFFGFVQNQSLASVALGLAKVFEREEAHELCSIRGVYRLAKQVEIRDIEAATVFVGKYGISASGDWIRDIDKVFSRHRPRFQSHMKKIDKVRNTRLAHIQQYAPAAVLPSIAAFDDLLGFAFDFHSFVNEAFLSESSHPILDDKRIETSLLNLLRKTGVSDPVRGDYGR